VADHVWAGHTANRAPLGTTGIATFNAIAQLTS